jgi:hypothetical protein
MKPDMSAILGLKTKKAPSAAPPDLPGAAQEAPLEAAEPELGAETPTEEMGESGLTPDMLDYHGASEGCGSCSHFTAPSTCDRWADPVEESGWCKGWQPSAGGAPGGEMGAAGAELAAPKAGGLPA